MSADLALRRLVQIIATASRDGGASLDELAGDLGVTPKEILAAVEAVADRDYYHRGGWVNDIVILVEPERLVVDRAGGFERPGKLNARELLCLAIGLRSLGAGALAGDQVRRELLRRVESGLAVMAPDEEAHRAFEIPDDRPDEDGIAETVLDAVRSRHVCRIGYLTRAENSRWRVVRDRDVEPYALARAEGYWYALSHCRLRDAPRAFRLDRVVSATLLEERFEVPEDFDAEEWISERRVYEGRDETTVRVRYEPSVARWAREEAANRGLPFEELDDGGVSVTYEVADWDWAVRHTLAWGPRAEIVEPPELREHMRGVLERFG